MNDPKYLELTRSIIVDNYTPERREWIRRLAAQQEPDMTVGISVRTILWIAAGIWATFVVMLLWGCERKEVSTASMSETVCQRVVAGERIADRCYRAKAPQGCRVLQDDGRWQKLECWKQKEAPPAPTHLRIVKP